LIGSGAALPRFAEGAIEVETALGDGFPLEIAGCMERGGGAGAGGEVGFGQVRFEGLGEFRDVAGGDDPAGDVVDDEFGEAGGAGDNDGFACGLGFDGDEAEEFGTVIDAAGGGERGLQDDGCAPVLAGKFVVIGIGDEGDLFSLGGFLEGLEVGGIVGPTDDMEASAWWQCLDDFADALVPEQTADEERVAVEGTGLRREELSGAPVEGDGGKRPVIEHAAGVDGEVGQTIGESIGEEARMDPAEVGGEGAAAAADVGEDDDLVSEQAAGEKAVCDGHREAHQVDDIVLGEGIPGLGGESGEEAGAGVGLVKDAGVEGGGFLGKGAVMEKGLVGVGEGGQAAGVFGCVPFAAADGAAFEVDGRGEDENAGEPGKGGGSGHGEGQAALLK